MVNEEYKKMKQDLREANVKVAGDPKRLRFKKDVSLKKGFTGKTVKTKKGGFKRVGGIVGLFKGKEVKGISRRERATRRALTALGASRLKPRTAGRPEGTGKYQRMGYKDVYEYRKAMAQQKAVMRMQRQREIQKLKRRGLTEEQINRLQLARTLEQQKRAIVPDSRRQMMQQAVNVADEEKDFARFRAEKTVSPNTQRLLTQLRRIQNKGTIDNIEQQRRIYEKRLLAEQGNLLKAKNLFGPESNTMNMLEVEGNILQAPNVFRTDDNTNILKERRGNVLDTNSYGNTLRF